MNDLVLHHYPASPFAEKVRLMLGYKRLSWKSVFIPMVMPKPDVLALTGGYRKTPILQVGADIYCDTMLIAEVLDELAPAQPALSGPQPALARCLAQWADSTLFWAAMSHSMQAAGMAQLFGKATPQAMQAFAEDRKAMSAGLSRPRPADGTSALRSYLLRLEQMLESSPFLLGQQPGVADFGSYHPLWFNRTQTPVMADVLQACPKVLAWMDRMAAIGHGQIERYSAEQAIDLARRSTLRSLQDEPFEDVHGIALGSRVSVAAEGFGPEPTEGQLLAATKSRYILGRSDERAGRVQVHFPRVGYALRALKD
jgi:glutathione S-transferase